MPSPLNIGGDPIFGMHADALRLHQRRLELIASNLANADTPNYRARDLDFQSALAKAAGASPGLAQTQSGHQPAAGSAGPDGVTYRTPTQNSLDGNSVDVQQEQAAFADSVVHYQASLMFAESRVRSLLAAISGE
jgi:flagellar basal-body rod protein FlgB